MEEVIVSLIVRKWVLAWFPEVNNEQNMLQPYRLSATRCAQCGARKKLTKLPQDWISAFSGGFPRYFCLRFSLLIIRGEVLLF